MTNTNTSIPLEELHLYHSIDRDIFNRLIHNLSRKIGESLLVIALWLWLEEKSFPNIIVRLQQLSSPVLAAVADEAVLCLRVLEQHHRDNDEHILVPNGLLSFTTRIMQREISLNFFVHNKFTAITGMKALLNNVCARIFTDILHVALPPRHRNPNDMTLIIPGFPHPTFGPISVMMHPLGKEFFTRGLWGCWTSNLVVSQDDRTMFLTFSRGFPLTPYDVTVFFNSVYRNCVEVVLMEEMRSNGDQPLYALMVLRSVSTIDKLLNGKHIAKFKTSSGKHIWARKFAPRG